MSDVFDAITSKRHYRDKMPIINVIGILLKDSGTHFDKAVVDCLLAASADKIMGVFLTENNLVLDEMHQTILGKYSMMDLYNFSAEEQSEELTNEKKSFINLFNYYYIAKSNEDNKP